MYTDVIQETVLIWKGKFQVKHSFKNLINDLKLGKKKWSFHFWEDYVK